MLLSDAFTITHRWVKNGPKDSNSDKRLFCTYNI